MLELWGTPEERKTDWLPTDKTITLITRASNHPYLLGVIKEGQVTIIHEPIGHRLVDNVVIADTPGHGDPEIVAEIARDFLPICDMILFLIPAASPLDQTDMPLLTELHKRLQFIPIHFVITRANEFKADTRLPVSENNIDAAKRNHFLSGLIQRLNSLTKHIYTEENFVFVDNLDHYNIHELVDFITVKSDP
jgi:predicted GTPase